ncbi:hypothetical protein [Brevundimonas sp.]|uniref:M61 family metallopeptidase n=1 Tax=Brevundimonas sp. TaxID=1871086 RepID=UPI0025E01BF8|nr:hypothetical protein [Brevundimonas sp.]
MAGTPAAQTRTEPSVDYVVTPIVEASGLRGVEISLAFVGDRDGRTEVRLPEAWSGAAGLGRDIIDVRAEGAEVRRDGARLTLRHARGADVRLSYVVAPDWIGPQRAGIERPYRPTVTADWFTLVGWTVFARIEGRDDAAVRFGWGDAPDGWALASDLDHAAGARMSFRDLGDSVLVGGAGMRVVSTPVAGGQARVAVHGDWRFSAEELAARYASVVQSSSDFWGDAGQTYLLALTPLDGPAGAGVQSGLGLGDGLAVWLTPDQVLDETDHVIVHEQQHAWLPDRVGGLARGPAEAMDFWFSEGFTDFYALRTELRLGLSTPEEHLGELNRILARHASTPTRGVGGAVLARAFFSDRQAAGAPYERGLLLALMWDARLRNASGGTRDLDDAILAIREGRGSAPERLVRAYRDLGGGELEPELEAHIGRGELIRLPPDLFGDCVIVAEASDGQRLLPGPGLSGAGRQACADRLAGL